MTSRFRLAGQTETLQPHICLCWWDSIHLPYLRLYLRVASVNLLLMMSHFAVAQHCFTTSVAIDQEFEALGIERLVREDEDIAKELENGSKEKMKECWALARIMTKCK